MEKKSANKQDAIDYLQSFPTAALLAIAKGELDIDQLVRSEIACRGVNEAGAWVGFKEAKKVWGVAN